MQLKLTAIVLILALLSACASQTAVFLSEPAGARVYIDGEPIGQTPCDYQYPLGAGFDYEVTVEKPGYEAVREVIRADETDSAARNRWLAAGVVWSPLWLGTFFTKRLKDGYEFVLRKAPTPVTAQAETTPGRYR